MEPIKVAEPELTPEQRTARRLRVMIERTCDTVPNEFRRLWLQEIWRKAILAEDKQMIAECNLVEIDIVREGNTLRAARELGAKVDAWFAKQEEAEKLSIPQGQKQ